MRSWRNWTASPPRTPLTSPIADASHLASEQGWSLHARLQLFVTIALLPIAVFSILQGIERARSDVATVHARLIQSAQRAALAEERLLSSAEQVTRAISAIKAVRDVAPACSSILKDALHGMKLFGNIARIDSSGVVVCSALPRAIGLDVNAQPLFKQASASNRFVVSGRILSVVLNRPVIAGMLPMHDAHGKFDGALSIALDIHWLDLLVRVRALSEGAVVFIYDVDGNILAANDPGVARALIARAAVPSGAAFRDGMDRDGNSWGLSSAPLPGGTIFVAFAMREMDLFGPTYVHVGLDFLMPILMLGLAWAGIWFATERQVAQWIAYLRRISAAYRSGHYAVRPHLERAPSEFRSLGLALSEMASAIQERNRHLRDVLEQKSILIRETHHRVKNNLQIMMSLLSLQAGQLRDPAARDALMQAQVRINTLALVHRSLHEIEDQTTVDLKRLLHELTHQIAQTMHGVEDVRIDEDLVARNISGEVAVPLALFVSEALTHVFKYAFIPGHAGVISLSLQACEGGKLRLSLADNGSGFDMSAPSRGIGAQLIRTFGRQIGGIATVDSRPGQGTTVQLIFDDPDAHHAIAGLARA